jgi:hypothetical protein
MFTHILVAENGRIYGKNSSPQATIMVDDPNINASTHWYDWEKREAVLKSEMPIEIDTVVISGVPCRCEAVVTGAVSHAFQLNPGPNPVTFSIPGEYHFTITPEDPQWLIYSHTFTYEEPEVELEVVE